MKRKVKLILSITILYDKDKDFYNHFTKDFKFRFPDPCELRFYLEKILQYTDICRVYFKETAFPGKMVRYNENFTTYRFGFLIKEVIL